jgi:hypothetical protein
MFSGNISLSGTVMTRFWFSLGLCVVLLVPEPATFALLVFAAACLAACALRVAAGCVEELASLRVPVPAEPRTANFE